MMNQAATKTEGNAKSSRFLRDLGSEYIFSRDKLRDFVASGYHWPPLAHKGIAAELPSDSMAVI